MFEIVNLYEFQKAVPDDIVRLQEFSRSYNDTVFRNAISKGKWWSEFTVTLGASPFQYILGGGQIWINGLGYVSVDGDDENLAVSAPVENNRWVAIQASILQTDTHPEQREFLRTTEQGQRVVEARDVSTVNSRLAVPNYALGEEAPQPLKPNTPTGNTVVIAWLLLSPNKIERIEMNTGGILPSIDALYAIATANGARLDIILPRVNTIETDLAGLRSDLQTKAPLERFAALSENVAALNEKADLPDVYVDYGADVFLDLLESDYSFPGYYAKVDDGLRFPPALTTEIKPIQPPQIGLDQRIYKHESGLVLPAFGESRYRTAPVSGFILMNAGYYDTTGIFVLSMNPNRTRFGQEFEVSAASDFWMTGRYTNIAQGAFQANDGRLFQVYPTTRLNDDGVQIFRVRLLFNESTAKGYWARTGAEAATAGYKYAQTLLNGKDRWLTGVSVHGQYWDPSAPVYLAVCEVKENGYPDLSNVLTWTSVAGSAMTPDIFYKIPIKPTFLRQGKTYAYVIWGVGANRVAFADSSVAVGIQGNFFAKAAGDTWQVDLSKSLCLDLWYAEFKNTRTEIELGDLSLLGGIASIEWQAPSIIPAGASFTLEAQVAGVYRSLAADNPVSPFTSLPTSTKIRAVLQGGTFNQPGFELPNSLLRASRPAPNLKHYSTQRTTQTPAKNFRFRELIEHYNPAKHTVSMKIEVGGTEYNPVSASDRIIDNSDTTDQTLERTWLFTLASNTSAFRRVTIGQTTDVNDLPVISDVKDVVLS